MKKIKQSFIITILLLFYSNSTYATTNEAYTVNDGTGFGKFMLFLIATILIGLVLFLSYKMDKNEELENRKERITGKKQKVKDNFDYKRAINSVIEKIKSIKLKKNINDEYVISSNDMNEYEDIEDEYIDDIYEEIYQEINNEVEDDIKVFEKIEEVKENIEENDEDIAEENLEEANTSKIAITNFKEVEQNTEKEVYYNADDENLNQFTMVFNSKLLKMEDVDDKKEENDTDDFGLDDIKEIIAAANIKKYTRKKDGKKYESKKKKKPSKRYTRKKGEPLVKKNVKKEKKQSRPQLKRGRPKKSDKPKRGRPKKEVKPKRGRPKKEIKPKRGRPKKEDTEKKSTTKK